MIEAQTCKQKSVRTRQAYPKSRPISADKQLIGQNNTSLPKIKTQICKKLISQNNRSLVAYPKYASQDPIQHKADLPQVCGWCLVWGEESGLWLKKKKKK